VGPRERQCDSRVSGSIQIEATSTLELTRHSHAQAHCIMKILKGSLTETLYAKPSADPKIDEHGPLKVLSETIYKKDEVTYMSDQLGVHRVSNPDSKNYAVSLHCASA
jgi:cysteine dioxygenase